MATLTDMLLEMMGERSFRLEALRPMKPKLLISKLAAIGVYGKLLTRDGDMTSEFIARCHAAAHEAVRLNVDGTRGVVVIVSGWASGQIDPQQPEELDTEGWKGADCIRREIRRIGGDTWPLYSSEECVELLASDNNIFPSIIFEPKARTTDENAKFIGCCLAQIRSRLGAILGIPEKSVPTKLAIATSAYHYARELQRLEIIPERSGLMFLRECLPGLEEAQVDVPYPPLASSRPGTSWRARLYVAAHELPDALLANLFWLGESEESLAQKRLSCKAIERAVLAVERFKELFDELAPFNEEKQKLYGHEIAELRSSLAAQLEPLQLLLQSILTKAAEVIEGHSSPAMIPVSQWKAWAVTLSGLIGKPIRWLADPDRR